MKKLIAVSALAAAFAAFADPESYRSASEFEGTELDAGLWVFDGATGTTDGSSIKAYDVEGNLAKPTIKSPGTFGDQYLELSTEGGILWRGFGAWDGTTPTPKQITEKGLFVDTLVQFTPTEDGEPPALEGGDEKLAIWLNVQDNVTNLMVKANLWSYENEEFAQNATAIPLSGKTIEAGTWYRLTVKAIDDLTTGSEDLKISGFKILIDGTEMTGTSFTAAALDALAETDLFGNTIADMRAGKIFASLQEATPGVPMSLTSVGFKGSGAIDDLVLTDEDPFPAPESIDFTLTWVGVTPVSYIIDDGEPILLSDATGTSFLIKGVPAGAPITFVYQNGDGVEKRTTGTIAENGSLAADEAYTWNEYLGTPVDGAYTIDGESDFELFQKGVNNAKIPTAGETFKLTANVALSEATDGIGARDMKDTLGSSLENYTAANVFNGTFDGGNHTISGVILKTGDYIGFFNSCYGATIKNLKLSLGNATGWSDAANNQVGAVFVGVSVNTTLENCQTLVAGDNDSFNTFKATKTAAGFVGYGANGTVISNCVNNLNIWSVGNEKAGGFVACGQSGKSTSSDGDGIEINGCSNLGDVKNGANAWVAGLVGYADLKVTLKGAITVAGTITAKSGAAKSLVGVNGGSVVVADGATFTVPAGYKAVTDGKAVDGLFFATVDGDVATLVKNSTLAAGDTYKVMATGGAPTIELAESETIAFDQTLATIDATGITAATGCEIEATGEGQPIVYTAVKTAPAWPTDDDWAEDADQAVKDKFAAWKEGAGAGVSAFAGNAAAFLLNVAPADVADLTIDSITVGDDGTATIVVSAGSIDLSEVNGVLYVEGSNDLANWTATTIELGKDATFADGKATFEVEGAKFMKAKIGFKAPAAQ